jgi:hypothetical protein
VYCFCRNHSIIRSSHSRLRHAPCCSPCKHMRWQPVRAEGCDPHLRPEGAWQAGLCRPTQGCHHCMLPRLLQGRPRPPRQQLAAAECAARCHQSRPAAAAAGDAMMTQLTRASLGAAAVQTHITSQHSTAQHSTAQHSTAQHSAPLVARGPLGSAGGGAPACPTARQAGPPGC